MCNVKTLDENELRNVNGCGPIFIFEQDYPSLTETQYHKNCGGVIGNVGDPTAFCVCSKCGEEHYLISWFDTYTLGIRRKED